MIREIYEWLEAILSFDDSFHRFLKTKFTNEQQTVNNY